MDIVVHQEKPRDQDGIRALNLAAFGQAEEADIVDLLRRRCDDLLSLVALAGQQVVGHILFSPAEVVSGAATIGGMGLAPMAVHPDYQSQGVGSQLIRAGMERLRQMACPFVIVLGHAAYYPRFGFEPASRHGLQCQWEAPDEAFMVRVLDADQMSGIRGIARYRPEFDAAM